MKKLACLIMLVGFSIIFVVSIPMGSGYKPWRGATELEKEALIAMRYAPVSAWVFLGGATILIGLALWVIADCSRNRYLKMVLVSMLAWIFVICLFMSYTSFSFDTRNTIDVLKSCTLLRAKNLARHLNLIEGKSLNEEFTLTDIYDKYLKELGVDRYAVFDSWGMVFEVSRTSGGVFLISSNCDGNGTIEVVTTNQ